MTVFKLDRTGPKSSDLEGWREVATAGRLCEHTLEEISAAFQDLRQRDRGLSHALTRYLSDAIAGMVRTRVSPHHPNEGRDIVNAAIAEIWIGLLDPESADGKGLRHAFRKRVDFRIKDAIAREERLRKAPASHYPHDGTPKAKKAPRQEFEGMEAGLNVADQDLAASVQALEQEIDINAFLIRHIPDGRKRLAFKYHMEEMPLSSERGASIAKALGVSGKTVGQWIEEVVTVLKEKVGELK